VLVPSAAVLVLEIVLSQPRIFEHEHEHEHEWEDESEPSSRWYTQPKISPKIGLTSLV
jgi:hypothetical protein